MFIKPKWYEMLSDYYKPISDEIIQKIENFRKENYLTDELLLIAIGTTRWAVRRIQNVTLESFRKEFPELTERELWKSVIVSRLQAKLNLLDVKDAPFMKPLSAQEIYTLIENLNEVIPNFKTFEDVIEYIINIDEKENAFYDPTGHQSELSKLLEAIE